MTSCVQFQTSTQTHHLVFFSLWKKSVNEGSERRSTKQESAWLFRIWYTFDHKYPLADHRKSVDFYYLTSYELHLLHMLVIRRLFKNQNQVYFRQVSKE